MEPHKSQNITFCYTRFRTDALYYLFGGTSWIRVHGQISSWEMKRVRVDRTALSLFFRGSICCPVGPMGNIYLFIDLGDFGALGVTLGDLGVTWGAPDALMLSIIRKYSFLFCFLIDRHSIRFSEARFPSSKSSTICQCWHLVISGMLC